MGPEEDTYLESSRPYAFDGLATQEHKSNNFTWDTPASFYSDMFVFFRAITNINRATLLTSLRLTFILIKPSRKRRRQAVAMISSQSSGFGGLLFRVSNALIPSRSGSIPGKARLGATDIRVNNGINNSWFLMLVPMSSPFPESGCKTLEPSRSLFRKDCSESHSDANVDRSMELWLLDLFGMATNDTKISDTGSQTGYSETERSGKRKHWVTTSFFVRIFARLACAMIFSY